MLNARMHMTNDDFWPAFWRATLLKLDVLAIFMSISLVVYFSVSWMTAGPVDVRAEALHEVKADYSAQMHAREPQSVPQARAAKPAQVRVEQQHQQQARVEKPFRLAQNRAPSNKAASVKSVDKRKFADAKRLSEKSRRN